jgi:hypothetical protein
MLFAGIVGCSGKEEQCQTTKVKKTNDGTYYQDFAAWLLIKLP